MIAGRGISIALWTESKDAALPLGLVEERLVSMEIAEKH